MLGAFFTQPWLTDQAPGRLRLDRLTATARLPFSFPYRDVTALLAEAVKSLFVPAGQNRS